jgi:hypothetical protein
LQLRFEARNQIRRNCGDTITTAASQGCRPRERRAQSEASRAQTTLNHFKWSRIGLTFEHRNRHRRRNTVPVFLFWRMIVVAHPETHSVQRLHPNRAAGFSRIVKPVPEQFIGLNRKGL